jgi:hypothetical protein
MSYKSKRWYWWNIATDEWDANYRNIATDEWDANYRNIEIITFVA